MKDGIPAAIAMGDPLGSVAPATRELYDYLIQRIRTLGPFQIEIKKTSIHLTRKSAFAGVHPRKLFLVITIKAERPIDNERITKAEQVSKSRWHLDVRVSSKEDIETDLLRWLKQAYELSG